MKRPKSFVTFFAFLSVVSFYFVTISIESCSNDSKKISSTAIAENENEFVGPDKCQSCHQKEYDLWKQSDHYHAMEIATDSTVKGNFNDQVFSADGVTSKMFRRDNKFYINTEGDDGNNYDFEVKYTFGYYPLQQYLVEFSRGRMQVPRISWDVKSNKWFHQYAGTKIDHNDWMHWTHDSQNWNTMCAECHSTNVQKNYDDNSDSFKTTYSHINVSCESCHGAGKNHIQYVTSVDYIKGNHIKGSYILLHSSDTNSVQLNACVLCHSRKTNIGSQPLTGNDVLDHFIPQIPDTEYYYADGQIKSEDYEYASFTQSKMFHRGVKCSNCHDAHTYKVKFDDNKLCTQCHAPKYDSPEHTFHPVNSEGALCKNCHMDTHTYMGVDIRRDHSIRNPRPDLSVANNVPNACTNCHKNKTNKWAADAVIKWFGTTRKVNYVDDLVAGSKLNNESIRHLNKLINDDSVPPIIRATAVYYKGLTNQDGDVESLLNALNNPNSVVRYHAVQALRNYNSQLWLTKVCDKLSDPVRAVRISASMTLSGIPESTIEKKYSNALSSAHGEMFAYLKGQTDFSVGCVMLADYYFNNKEYDLAEKYYLKTLKKDSLANYARLNLASAYDAQGKTDKALQVLNTAAITDKSNGRIFYNLALLHNELNDGKNTILNFEKAVSLQFDDPGLYYNYGLLLLKTGNLKKSESVLKTGVTAYPNSAEINYAIAYFYLQNKQKEQARPYALKCNQLDANNPDYKTLLKYVQ